jgi:hypothetical protein
MVDVWTSSYESVWRRVLAVQVLGKVAPHDSFCLRLLVAETAEHPGKKSGHRITQALDGIAKLDCKMR